MKKHATVWFHREETGYMDALWDKWSEDKHGMSYEELYAIYEQWYFGELALGFTSEQQMAAWRANYE